MKYLSLFSGIGGFELGIGDKGECIGFSEIDKYATAIYSKHFPQHKNYGDITKIEPADLPDFDLLVGGFPCQSFSIAGRRGGFEDTRGTLFFEIARIVKNKRPPLLLLENVKGLLSHDEGRTFAVVISTLNDLGYDLQWQVLNSKDFGVPQNRERIFIVGHLRGIPRPQVFPFGENDGVPEIANGSEKRQSQAPISHTLRGNNDKADQVYVIHNVYGGFGEEKVRKFKDYSPTLRTPKGGGHIPNVVTGFQIRRFTPVECERLQGFPDNWTAGISDAQRYKCLGNAVTVNVIEQLIHRIALACVPCMR
jgi:DNA (cytosine-5)-methyltransferase 1